MLVQVCGSEAVSKNMCTKGSNAFTEGRKRQVESRSGRASASRTPEMIEKVAQYRQLTLRLIAEELGISKDKRTPSSAMIWVSGRSASDLCRTTHRRAESKTDGNFISLYDQYPLLLENIVTGNETWCYQFDPESKQQSMVWCSPTSPRPKKSHLQKSKV